MVVRDQPGQLYDTPGQQSQLRLRVLGWQLRQTTSGRMVTLVWVLQDAVNIYSDSWTINFADQLAVG